MTRPLNVVELECSACGKKYEASVEQHLCTCGKPLLARYDLRRAATTLTLENLKNRSRTLWRYAEVLPNDPPVSLGEGVTALVHAKRLGASIRCGQGGLQRLYVKDEGLNPTGSFKARGMTVAVSRAKQLGAKALAAPQPATRGARWLPTPQPPEFPQSS
jgi:threonine synthase